MLLRKKEDLQFMLFDTFKGEFLSPLIDNLKIKFTNEYDDYNEVYHCNQLIHQLQELPNIHLDYHVLYKNNECVGLALICTGNLKSKYFFSKDNVIEDTKEAIILNYFHISPSARGNGAYWLKEIIMPYYKDLGKTTIYLKSSHQKAFSLYERLGKRIGEYSSWSDNHQYSREGAIFKILL